MGWLEQTVDNSALARRIWEIRELLYENKVEHNLGARLRVYLISLETIIKYPFTGAIFRMSDATFLDYVGHHSSLLDNLAIFGVIPGGVWFYIIGYPLYRTISDSKEQDRPLVISVGAVFTIISLFDNIIPGMGIMMYFLCPYLVYKDSVVSEEQ